jgi:hypothetical protein
LREAFVVSIGAWALWPSGMVVLSKNSFDIWPSIERVRPAVRL